MIKSITGGHSDLQMVIAQLKDVRVASKGFTTAQCTAMQDLVKWSMKDENRAIQDALTQIDELFSVWAEVQRELTENLKDFRHQFEMVLEGARQLDVARTTLQVAEQKETKIKKELKKVAKKATADEIREMSGKLSEAEREKDIAQLEVVDKVREHEVVKLIRIKEGLYKMAEGYVDYAQKCDVIFQAQRDIALQIPDVTDQDIQDIKYTGSGATMQAVSLAKDKIKRFRRRTSSTGSAIYHGHAADRSHHSTTDLPPPYTENPPPVNPFYNELSGGNHSCSFEYDYREEGGSAAVSPVLPPPRGEAGNVSAPAYSPLGHPPLYPVLNSPDQSYHQNNIPAYSTDGGPQYGGGGGSNVTSRRHVYRNSTSSPNTDLTSHITGSRTRLVRRSSCFSDAEDVTEAISNINLSLDTQRDRAHHK